MKIPNANSGNKILFIFLDALFLLMIIIAPLENQYISFMWFVILCALLLFAISLCLCATFLAFGTYEINGDGISFKSLIYKKFCKWSDFKFIVKYNVHMRYAPRIGFICSHTLSRDKIKRIHITKDFSTKYFNLPYSKKTEDLILTYGINSYSGIFTDDNKMDKIKY